mgnify:CR=1 FL=1
MIRKILRGAVLAGLCFAGWLAVTRDVHPGSLAGAAALSLAAAAFSGRVFFEQNPLETARPFWRVHAIVGLIVMLLVLGYVASAELIGRMLTGRYRPGVVRIRTRLRSRIGRVMLANTITLVPGTMSLWLDDRHILVHWFDVKTDHTVRAGDLIKRQVEARLERVFG